MKLLVDTNLSPRWVKVLIGAGFDAIHWSQSASAFNTEASGFAAQIKPCAAAGKALGFAFMNQWRSVSH